MRDFAHLLNRLYFTYSHLAKARLLIDYLKNTPDPDRGFALAIIAGSLKFPAFKRTLIKELIQARVDPNLFTLSYDYVGDLSETISLLWPKGATTFDNPLPTLTEIIKQLTTLPKAELGNYIAYLLDSGDEVERWALLKLGAGSLRIGVSARFIRQVLAQYGEKSVHDIEQVWHGFQPPYVDMLAWLENKIPKPDLSQAIYFHPVMLANPLEEKELEKISPEYFVIERKYDGIRVQFIVTAKDKALYSRTGDDISAAFPDVMTFSGEDSFVLDGELVIKSNDKIGSFNDLQQRLNRKAPSKQLIQSSPAHIILYDILMLNNQDVRQLPFLARRKLLEDWFVKTGSTQFSLSNLLLFQDQKSLITLKQQVLAEQDIAVEGLMLKHKESLYTAGRPAGQWYKWKRDPYLIDAVLLYAQRGHGKRSSYYSDYTFGLWADDSLLPVGKAYFGFTDEELKLLDKWIRNNTINRFGPVREVKKELVLEVAFEAVNISSRHKSGFALRFPRIHRIRWDKPANEADHLSLLKRYLSP